MTTLSLHFTVLDFRWKKILAEHKAFFRKALKTTADALELPPQKFSVSLVFMDDDGIRELNSDYRHKNKPTNVLSFPVIEDFSALPDTDDVLELGDIILAYETILREAAEQGKSPRDHVAHLLVHGLLHLFGYDHMAKREEKEMEALETGILAGLGIADPYR